MTAGARRLPAALLASALLVTALAAPARSQEDAAPEPGRAFLFLIDRVSFEELLAVEEFRALATSGGAAMLSRRRHPQDAGLGAWLTIGAGAKAAVPSSRIAAFPADAAFPAATLAGIRAVNDAAVPGLLAQVLADRGRTVRVYGNADDRFGPNVPGLLVGMDVTGAATGRIHGVVVPRPERLGGLRTDYAELARLLVPSLSNGKLTAPRPADLSVVDLGDTHRIDQEAPYARDGVAAAERARALRTAGRFVESVVRESGGHALVIVATPSESEDMRAAGDLVTPVIVAEGPARELFPRDGVPGGLTGTSTRYPGLVLAEDIAPTILQHFGLARPLEMTGAPIEFAGEAPFASHLRHLEHRRIRVPIQAGFGLFGLLLVLLAAVLVFVRRRVSPRLLSVAGTTAAAAVAIPLALLLMGLSPNIVYTQVLPIGLVVTTIVGLVAWRLRRRDPGFPVVLVAAVSGYAVLVDGLFGWPASSTSLAGGTVYEGRAYGIRNLWVGPVLAGTILLCSRLRPRVGLAVGLGVAAFAGIPGLGSDVGGYMTLSVTAWFLYYLLARGRIHLRELVITGAATAAGLALLLVFDGVFNPTPTHAGRFAERVASDGFGTLVGVAVDRLELSLRTINQGPPAWIIVAWFAFAVWFTPRLAGPIGAAFDRSPGYREAMWVLAAGALLAIVFNDTGISTATAAAAYSIGGFVVPALAWRDGRDRDPAAEHARRAVVRERVAV